MSSERNEPDQISLPFPDTDRNSLDGFYTGPNAALKETLARLALKDASAMLYVHGPRGVGKSHLLQGVVRMAAGGGLRAVYIPLKMPGIEPEMLRQQEPAALLCLDDVHRAAGDDEWERALLEAFERSREARGGLLMAGALPPQRLGLSLMDLSSRLSGQLVYQIAELDDAEKSRALRWCAKRRGLELTGETVEWLLKRTNRETAALFELLDAIDRTALREGNRVTIPFLKRFGLV